MNKRIDCPVVILSGGKSTRMGCDKSLLPFDRYNTLIEYQHDKFKKIFQEVYISSKEDKFPFLEDKTKLLKDNSSTYSPMGALQSILNCFEDKYIFIIAVDIPFLKQQTILKLFNFTKEGKYQIVLPVDNVGNIHNLCGFYHTSLLNQIDTLLKEDTHRIGALIQNSQSTAIEFNTLTEFVNLNDQETYKQACIYIKR